MARKLKIIGARLAVIDIITTLSLVERGRKSDLEIITDESNNPRPTQGRVIVLGTDPLIREEFKVGDIVSFDWHAGTGLVHEDIQYRVLEFQEIIATDQEE